MSEVLIYNNNFTLRNQTQALIPLGKGDTLQVTKVNKPNELKVKRRKVEAKGFQKAGLLFQILDHPTTKEKALLCRHRKELFYA